MSSGYASTRAIRMAEKAIGKGVRLEAYGDMFADARAEAEAATDALAKAEGRKKRKGSNKPAESAKKGKKEKEDTTEKTQAEKEKSEKKVDEVFRDDESYLQRRSLDEVKKVHRQLEQADEEARKKMLKAYNKPVGGGRVAGQFATWCFPGNGYVDETGSVSDWKDIHPKFTRAAFLAVFELAKAAGVNRRQVIDTIVSKIDTIKD